jgi:hypothetical protein
LQTGDWAAVDQSDKIERGADILRQGWLGLERRPVGVVAQAQQHLANVLVHR